MGFSRQEYWSGLPCPPPEDLPDPGSNPGVLYCRQILYDLSHRWGFPPHQAILRRQLGILQFSSILTLSTWGQGQIPQVRALVLQDCSLTPSSDTNRKSMLSPGLLTHQLWIGDYNNSLLGFDSGSQNSNILLTRLHVYCRSL